MNTTFNETVGGRNWHSETELINALQATLDAKCEKQKLNKQKLIDAARSVAPTEFAEWQVLTWAISGAQTMTHKGRSCGVSDAYKGAAAQQIADDACGKCAGSGKYEFSTGATGVCYQCNGNGKEKKS
jgi:hypothetical protein